MRGEMVNFIKHGGRNLVFSKIGGFMELIEFKLIFEQFKKNYWNWGMIF